MKTTNVIGSITTILLAPLLLAGDGEGTLPLSLREAVQLASSQSYQVQIAENELHESRGDNLQSWSGFLPRLSLSENFIKSNDPVTVFSLKLKQGVFGQSDFALPILNDPDAFDNFTTALHIQQPLVNLDAIYGKAAAGLAVQAKELALSRAREGAALHAERAYYGLLLAIEKQTALAKAVAAAAAHRDNARAAVEQGIISEADHLAAQVRLAELQEQLISAGHDIDNADDGLKFILGITDGRSIFPTDTLMLPDPATPNSSPVPGSAERSDVRAIGLQARAAARNHQRNVSEWVPRMNAFGGLEWNGTDSFSNHASNWTVGVQLQWSLFEGLGRFGRAKKAAAQREKAEVYHRQALRAAELEARKSHRALLAAGERVRVSETVVKMASESLRMIRERFDQGLEKVSELLDREAVLTNARLRYLKSRYDYFIAKSELRYALGLSINTTEE